MSKKYLLKENVILLANGEFPKHNNPINLLNNSDCIICCDGAVNSLINFGKEPYVIIGDLDSIDSKIKNVYSNNIFKIENQDDNDLRKALSWISDNIHLHKLYILGSTGLREDHAIGNIATFLYQSYDFEIEILTNTGVFHIMNSSKTIKTSIGKHVSLFCINEKQRITTTGLKYELNNASINLYSATLNTAQSNQLSINTTINTPLLVYISY